MQSTTDKKNIVTANAEPEKWNSVEAKTHQHIEEGGEDDGAVAPEARISKKCTEEREHTGGTWPRVHGGSGGGRGLAEGPREVHDKVRGDAVEREPLRDLHTCMIRSVRFHERFESCWPHNSSKISEISNLRRNCRWKIHNSASSLIHPWSQM